MNIVQSLWTNDQDLLIKDFGWINAQAHLCSWTLSCLTLCEFYKNVKLYTDSNCARLFIDILKLPYKDVIVCYDKMECPQEHWAYPKIITYSKQESPFLHIDGDLFLPIKLTSAVEDADIIVQNLEIGTSYYKNMMNSLLKMGVDIPEYLANDLNVESIGSYNAGVFGGNDIDFIKLYCDEAIKLIKNNKLDSLLCTKKSINNNILFEQVLLYSLVKKYSKKVSTIIDKKIKDNGYSCSEFCCFRNYDSVPLLHILGGHKRNKKIVKQMEETLLYKYPEYYLRILKLFPDRNIRMNTIQEYNNDEVQMELCIAKYYDWQQSILNKWKNIPIDQLINIEKEIKGYYSYLKNSDAVWDEFEVILHPYIEIFVIPKTWPNKFKDVLFNKFTNYSVAIGRDVLCVPCVEGKGYKELVIGDIAYNIISIIFNNGSSVSLRNLNVELWNNVSGMMAKDRVKTQLLFNKEIEYLLENGIIFFN